MNFDLCYKGLVAMLTLKRHLTLKGTDLFFSLFQTLPDFGFPRGILLRFLPSSVVLDTAMLFHVLTEPARESADSPLAPRHFLIQHGGQNVPIWTDCSPAFSGVFPLQIIICFCEQKASPPWTCSCVSYSRCKEIL